MGLPGVTDRTVYEGLKDVLKRQPEVTTVAYEPDSISKKFLRAKIDTTRVPVTTEPESPAIDVEWRFDNGESYYRIHYHDPNIGFNCGWHRDDDHPALGPVHFQYNHPDTNESGYEAVEFTKRAPTEILWDAIDRLFEQQLPSLLQTDSL